MLISLAEYAKIHGKEESTVRQKVLRGNLNAQKIGRNWIIDSDEPYEDHRRKPADTPNGKTRKKKQTPKKEAPHEDTV